MNNKCCLKYHEIDRYANEDPLPYYRGTLHLGTSIIIPFLALLFINNFNDNWTLIIFLFGKFISYSASAILHLGTIRDLNNHITCLLIDKVGVYISVFVTGIPFAQSNILFYYGFNSIVLIYGILFLINDYESSRKILFIFQSIVVSCFIGYKSDYNTLWIISIVLYISSIISFLPCVIKNNNTNDMVEVCLSVFWHKYGRNGCHEDFHNLLFLGDIFAFINAYFFVKNIVI